MPYQTDIVKALQRYGLDVDVTDGWQTRGSSSFNPAGVVGHHTAGPKTGDRPSLEVCIYGRPDLDGPLCNVFLPRGLSASQQAPVVVAAGRANHAGSGGYRGLSGNSSVFGIEAEDDGTDNIWTDWQLWAYPRVVAGLLSIPGRDETWYCSHRTWAPDRKIDPHDIRDSWMQAQVQAVLSGTAEDQERDDMGIFICHTSDGRQWKCGFGGKIHITKMSIVDELRRIGVEDKGQVSSEMLEVFPTMTAADLGSLVQYGDQLSAKLNSIESRLVTVEDKVDALAPVEPAPPADA